MPYSVPRRVSRSGGVKGNSRAREDVSNVRQLPTAFKPRGRVASRPSRWRKAKSSSLPSVAATWAFARWTIAVSDGASSAWRVTASEAWNSRSWPRCSASRSRVTSSRAIAASAGMVRPRRSDHDCADSKRTFCHSSVRAACAAGIGPTWIARSMGAPVARRPWRKPGPSDRGQRPRCSERVREPPTRTLRRPTSIVTGMASSVAVGAPPRAVATTNIRRARPLKRCAESPARASRPCRSSIRSTAQTA